MFFTQKAVENESVFGDADDRDDSDAEYDFVFDLDKSSWMNLWGIFGILLVINALCIAFFFRRKRKDESFRV